jgi:hypothetical protein
VAEAAFSGVCTNTQAGGLMSAKAAARTSFILCRANRRAAFDVSALKE